MKWYGKEEGIPKHVVYLCIGCGEEERLILRMKAMFFFVYSRRKVNERMLRPCALVAEMYNDKAAVDWWLRTYTPEPLAKRVLEA